jgi:4-amino-4-deoxy-L-arabinose transferase-like glycosyltransferase
MLPDAPPKRRTDPCVVALLLLGIVILAPGLKDGSFFEDEACYAEVTRRIAETGHWWRLDIGETPYFNKPPLVFWVTAALRSVLGGSNFVMRLPSVLFGLGALVLVYRLGARILSRWAGFFGACLLVISPEFVKQTSVLRLESLSLLLLLAMLLDFVRGIQDERPGLHARVGLWAGLAFLTKRAFAAYGLVAVVALALALRRPRALARPRFLLGALGGLVLGSFWPWLQWRVHGQIYIDEAWGQQFVARLGSDQFGDTSPLLYLESLAEKYLPVALLAVAGVVQLARGGAAQRRALLLLAAWAVPITVMISAPERHFGRYLIPVYPVIALLAGHVVAGWAGAERSLAFAFGLRRWVGALALLLLVAPVEFHNDRAESLIWLRPLIDAHEPGDAVHCLGGETLVQWHAQALYYLDRELIVHSNEEALEASGARYALAWREWSGRLERRGWTRYPGAGFFSVFERPDAAQRAR